MMANKKTLIITADGSQLLTTVNQMTAAFKKMEKNSAEMGVKVSRSMQVIENSAKTAAAGIKTLAAGLVITATGGGLQSILRTADAFKQLNARVMVASQGLGDATANYAQLSKQAQTAGTYLETTVAVFQRMAMVAPSLQATNAEILRVTDTVQKLSVITGAGSEQMKYGLTQLGQAFGQTYIMAEEFNSLNENIPGVLKAVADQMGMTTGELRNMQRDGKLASKDFFEALLAASAKADEAFTKMPVTVERATNSIRISFTNMVGKLDEATGATSILAQGMVSLSKGFDGTIRSIDAVTKAYKEHKSVIDNVVAIMVGAGGFIVAMQVAQYTAPLLASAVTGLAVAFDGLAVASLAARAALALTNPLMLAAIAAVPLGVAAMQSAEAREAEKRKGELKAAQGQVKYQQARLDPNYLKGQISSLQAQKAKLGKVGLGQSSMAIDAQIADFQNQLARLEGRAPKASTLNIPKVSIPRVGGGGGGRGRAGGGGRSGASPKAEKEFVAERIEPVSEYMEGLMKRSTEILNSLKTPFDIFNEQVAELDLLAKNNLLSFDAFNAKLAEYRQELDATLPVSEATKTAWEEYSEAVGQAGKSLSSTNSLMNDLQQVTVNVGTEFANMVASGKLSFADLANSLLRDIARVAIQLKIVTPLMNALFGAQGQGGGLLGQATMAFQNRFMGLNTPALRGIPSAASALPMAPIPAMPQGFANGGMPPVGRPVLVGERGAELVTFGQQARVHSNQDTKAMLGGGGSNVVVNIHNAPEGTKAQRSNQGGVDVIDIVLGKVASSIASGSGAIPKALNNRYGLNPAMGNG